MGIIFSTPQTSDANEGESGDDITIRLNRSVKKKKKKKPCERFSFKEERNNNNNGIVRAHFPHRVLSLFFYLLGKNRREK